MWLKFSAAYCDGRWQSPFWIQLNASGRIAAAHGNGGQIPRDQDCQIIEGYLIPGLDNTHSHSFQYALGGLSEKVAKDRDSDDFWLWREQMYQLANQIEADELLAITTQLYMNCLEHGYTSVCEFHYLHHDRQGKAYNNVAALSEAIMEAARIAGIRLTLVPIYYQQAAPHVAIKPQQRRFFMPDRDAYLKLVEEASAIAQKAFPEVVVGHGVHSMRAANLEDMRFILDKRWSKGPIHLHASEQVADVEVFEAAYNCRPIDWLASNITLGPQHNLVHATHVSRDELNTLLQSKANIVLCPTTEGNLGDGVFPIAEFQKQGGSWSVASDSQVNLSPFWEMQIPEMIHRFLLRRRNVFTNSENKNSGKLIYDQVLKAGRKAMGYGAVGFEVGAYFEGLVLDSRHDRIIHRSLDDVLSILIFTPEKDLIRDVWTFGRLRVQGGRHLAKAQNSEDFRKATRSLMEGLASFR